MMNFSRIIALVIIAATVSVAEVNTSNAPSILLILVDDMGFSDLGCYGGEINTPTIDRLASNGLRYAQFYNCARCWASRAALLSGYYPQQINRDSVLDVKGGGRGERPQWAHLLPDYLKPAGYRSYHSGKWHIDGTPIGNGFDRSFYIGDQDRFFSPKKLFKEDKKFTPAKSKEGFYATTAVADHAIECLKEHQVNDADKPFFSFVAFTAPHFPLQALPEDIERVGDRYRVGWDAIRNQRWERLQNMGLVKGTLSKVERNQGPPYDFSKKLKILGDGEVNRPVPWNDLTEKQKKFQQDKMTLHAAMVERIDIEVGRIIKQLKTMNVFNDTIIFFLSDNGASAEMMVRGDGHDPKAVPGSAKSYLCLGPGWSTTCNTPFRKHKTWVHEGGSCTPFIVHWPNKIRRKGEICQTPGHVIDLLPTILDATGVSVDDQKVASPGISIFKQEFEHKRALWWSHEGNNALRYGDWKLVKVKRGNWELYNLEEDRAETKNLATQYPEKVIEMKNLWENQVEDFRQIKKLEQ
jgi:arylsulfatase A-like enzyme